MFALLVILMTVGSGWCVDRHGSHPYVQARTDYLYARLVLQNLVPQDNNNLTNPSTRKHLSAGILTAVTSAVGESVVPLGAPYRPLVVLLRTIPAVFKDYNGVAADPLNYRLAEVNAKIQPITNIMDLLCVGADVETCNGIVENSVRNNSFLNLRADILLSAGRVARSLRKHEKDINQAVATNTPVLLLIQAMETPEYKQLAYDLAELDRQMVYLKAP